MINVIIKCLGKSKIEHHKWDYHPAFVHFGKCKNTFRNGKPLKWYHILKRGDHIEIIDSPKAPVLFGIGFIIGFLAVTAVTPIGIGLLVLGVAGAVANSYLGKQNAGTAAGASQKTYSSSSQAELRGASNDISSSIIPVLFGKTQQTSNYGQLPYRLVGDGNSTNKLLSYFIPNYNNVVYSDYKLGDTALTSYSSNYIDIVESYGGSSFIGFDNCKPIDVNEELGYDKDGAVLKVSEIEYWGIPIGIDHSFTSLFYGPSIRFYNVDIANWGTKKFNINIMYRRYNVSTGVTTSATYSASTGNILSTDISLSPRGDYYSIDDIQFTVYSTTVQHIYYIDKITITPTLDTRSNIYETVKELDTLHAISVFWDGFDEFSTKVLDANLPVDKYTGELARIINTSPENTTEIDVLFSFPQGLYRLSSTGTRTARSVNVSIEYKEFTETVWHPISDATIYYRDLQGIKQSLSGSTTTVAGSIVTLRNPTDLNVADQLFFRPIGIELPSGKYSVRVCAGELTAKTNYDVGVPYCAEVQFRAEGDPVALTMLPKVNQLALNATAYKGLSGTLKKFNYIGEAEIPIWDGSDWSTIDKTTNPAAIIRFLLTDSLVNPRYISTDFIDNDTLVELYNWCEDEEYKASGIISDEVKISEVISNILANCQAAMIPLFNGKHTFVIDKPNKTPIGLFNQHNSFDFKWYPSVGRQVTAIRASFLDNDDYTTDELTVYWYDGAVYETIKVGTSDDDYDIVKKEYKYVNDRASVLKIAKYDLETIQSKRNNFEFSVNLEALNMMLLDRCYISNSTNMQNESSGLIKDVITNSGNLIGFRLYSEIEIPENAKIVIRSLDYTNEVPVINIYDVTNKGLSDTVSIASVVYDGNIRGAGDIQGLSDTWHYDGDLFSIGQDTVYDCTITDIKYNEDNTATITAREY